MILAWDNLADAAALTASSEEATLPGENVQHPHLSKKWHTLTAVKSASLLFDMGSSVSCSLLAVLGTNLTPTATVRLRGSDSDATGVTGEKYDSTLIAAGVAAGYGAIYKGFTAAAARYWLLDLADASVADHLEIGRVFLGPSWTPAQPQSWGWAIGAVISDAVDYSKGGQAFGEVGARRRRVEFQLNYLTQAEAMESVLAMLLANGRVTDVLAIHDLTGTHLSQQAVFGGCEVDQPIINRLLNVWSRRFTITEAL